jgi:hypothetical protein
MKDQLDQMTDAQLSEAVAVECAGWTQLPPVNSGGDWWQDSTGQIAIDGPDFAIDANAVLPLLGLIHWWHISFADGKYIMELDTGNNDKIETVSLAPTFARAACIALLRAKRSKK